MGLPTHYSWLLTSTRSHCTGEVEVAGVGERAQGGLSGEGEMPDYGLGGEGADTGEAGFSVREESTQTGEGGEGEGR